MCRNIRRLYNYAPPVTDAEIHDAALQFVRKVSGSARPAQVNVAAFDTAVSEIASATRRLLDQLKTSAPPRSREEDARRARERRAAREGLRGRA
jgi:hypothetical protein